MRYPRLAFQPTTALWAVIAVLMTFIVLDVSAQFRNRGRDVLEVRYDRAAHDVTTGETRLLETGAHFIADDGRYRRDLTTLVAPDGGDVDQRTSEIWIPPEGVSLDAWIPPGVGAEFDLAPANFLAERITLDHEMRVAVRGPLGMVWQPPSEYASPLPIEPETGIPPPAPPGAVDMETMMANVPEDLGEKTIGAMLVHGRRQLLPLPDMVLTVEFWEVVRPQTSRNPLPIVVERFIRDETGNGETMRVRSAARTNVAPDFFDVPAGYRVQEIGRR